MSPLRLRVAELLKERGITAYRLAKDSGGRISLRTAYKLRDNELSQVPIEVMDALVDVFGLKDTGPLFEKVGAKRKGARGA